MQENKVCICPSNQLLGLTLAEIRNDQFLSSTILTASSLFLQPMKYPSLHIQKFSSMMLLVSQSLLDIRLWTLGVVSAANNLRKQFSTRWSTLPSRLCLTEPKSV